MAIRQQRCKHRFYRNSMPWLFLLVVGSLSAFAAGQQTAKSELDLQRESFREAVELVRTGYLEQAERARAKLGDYVLLPYFELELFKARIYQLSPAEAQAYLERYEDTVVGSYMQRAWLSKLIQKREWEAFLQHADGNAPAGMSCDYVKALRATGRHEEADAKTRSLWLTGYSLPDSCDTILANWLARLSDAEARAMHKRRAMLALQAGQSGLARYLLRNLPGTEIQQAILARPGNLYQEGFELEVTDFNRELVIHTLQRLAATDFDRGNTLWHQLNPRFKFSLQENHKLRDRFAREMIAGGAEFARDWLSAHDPGHEDPYLTEWRVRLALKDHDWEAVQRLIGVLPQTVREKSEWQYWWVRADIELNQGMTANAQAILAKMAAERGYYSFMAADLLGQDYQLGSNRTLQPELMAGIAELDAVKRARELYWHGLARNADIEWRRAVRNLDREQQIAAAQLALDWGWPHAAITTAIRAGEWDDLKLRFPLAFHSAFKDNARQSQIDLNWSYAIARQESAFAEHAQSRVGARGVMQLMPATANHIARQMGRPHPSLQDLYKPKVNIEMGSFYLGELLKEFGGNHILATAAYNAGPSRIKRVLERQKAPMSADVWIENLPYSETREYIKNVLAFSVVYGLKLDICKTPSLQSGCNTSKEERYTFIDPLVFEDDKG